MKIKDIFQKDIFRTIDPVVKVDERDPKKISNEVAEYVITQEISDKIGEFFNSYGSNSGDNGVWISGFYGSGKSHLLKILSFVLENKTLDGYPIGELFAEKVEEDNPMLKSEVLATSKILSESILFNIDSKSETKQDHMVEVFYGVFYDHLGYYGFRPHVAEFEMWLDRDGDFKKFKELFSQKSGKSWKRSRTDYWDPYVKKNLSESLGEIKGVDPSEYKNVLENYKRNQKHSIDDFCDLVQGYIAKKGKGFRLNFFIDEVGQYISNNSKLMLNLQTIAESLATKTKGNSWIFVTSQEKLEDIAGNMNESRQNDFSRIQARFSVKITLTSANVDEMIEKRLLQKKAEPQTELKDIFSKQRDHLRTIYRFSDEGVQFSWYEDEIDFANKFPFVPYQFFLFKECLATLSKYNYFHGKHSSVGERSMLIVFQKVIQRLGDFELDNLVSWDRIFEGIRNWLKSENISSIILGEKNLANQWSMRVLKALFLVKYYKDFLSTKKNVSVLLSDVYSNGRSSHSKNVEEALNQLENENYIQRSGYLYEFLTDLEHTVETEIDNESIENQAVNHFLKEIFFNEIIKDSKIRYEGNNYEYKFSAKIDGAVLTRKEELEIEIITPNHSNYNQKSKLSLASMASTTLVLILPDDGIFINDIKMYIKTKKYYQRNISDSLEVNKKRVIVEKDAYNQKRKSDVLVLARDLLSRSEVVINGSVHDVKGISDSKMKVVRAFDILIKTVYPNLKMLGDIRYSEDKLKEILLSDSPYVTLDIPISEAEEEISNYLTRQKNQSERTSLNDLKNYFGQKPYGWYPDAIWCLAAQLFIRNKIEIKQDSNLLEKQQIMNVILTGSNHDNALVESTTQIDQVLIRKLKDLYHEIFDESCPAHGPKEIVSSFKSKLSDLIVQVNQWTVQEDNYPFLTSLKSFRENLVILKEKDYIYFFDNICEFKKWLLDSKENLFDSISKFMKGEQKEIYDEVNIFLDGENSSNLFYLKDDRIQQLKQLIDDPEIFRNNRIREASSLMDKLKTKLYDLIKQEKKLASTTIDKIISRFKSEGGFIELDDKTKSSLVIPFEQNLGKVDESSLISMIREIVSNIENHIEPKQRTELQKAKDNSEQNRVEYIKANQILIPYSRKEELCTDDDVDDYVEVLRDEYKKQITQSKRIIL